ncbi:chloramphenicol resistance permease RarD [Psychromonas marina]|uniref:Chloramphenicol resistance permease RarD n=1 Tax=Psychromonas marina TaxID=88364 RepID=A0ABQ6E3Y1_9GAMM|nr:EamA family transporter RarD [Psychromonas marina]GLS91913.1 chloramphenicol resistance permease RarD [Psychromonas marina]
MKQLTETQLGIFYALGAYLMWGFAPIYFKYLDAIPVGEILAHRVVWSVLVTGFIITVTGRWKNVREICVAPKKLLLLVVTTLLISCNWMVFIWAVTNERMLEASLGYFINPMINVVLGLVFLNESLSRIKWVAVGLAFVGVLMQVIAVGSLPWVSLVLPISFAFYGLIRKKIKVESLTGLFIETLLVAPIALYYLFAIADSEYINMLENDLSLNFWLMFAGVVTALPLIFFGQAALRLKLSTLGFFQYLAPSLLFIFAVLFYGEELDLGKMLTFLFIWSGIVVFAFEKQIQQKLK